MTDEYDKYLKNAIEALDKAEVAIDEMLDFCSCGEPELFGSKAMKLFFENLKDLNANGMYFLYEKQAETKHHEEKSK